MAHFGKHWKIDGVCAAFVRPGRENGQYRVLFERDYAELPDIEGINWAKPTIEHLVDRPNEPALPEGYGFEVVDITYDSAGRSYTVELKTAAQYLGDVTGYQTQVDALQATVTEQAAVIQNQETEIESKEATIQAQTATISEQECTIQEQNTTIESLKESGSAALEAELDAAYEEGVNSVE